MATSTVEKKKHKNASSNGQVHVSSAENSNCDTTATLPPPNVLRRYKQTEKCCEKYLTTDRVREAPLKAN